MLTTNLGHSPTKKRQNKQTKKNYFKMIKEKRRKDVKMYLFMYVCMYCFISYSIYLYLTIYLFLFSSQLWFPTYCISSPMYTSKKVTMVFQLNIFCTLVVRTSTCGWNVVPVWRVELKVSSDDATKDDAIMQICILLLSFIVERGVTW